MDCGALPMSEREYWFARRYPLGDSRQAVSPVHWKGYAMTAIYTIALFTGGGLFVYFGMDDQLLIGVAVFAGVALVAGVWFVLTAKANGDPVRTVAEYKKDKQQRV
jgi:hypothetical protein